MIAIVGDKLIEWNPIMEYAEQNPQNWKEVYGEDVPYLDWNKAYGD